MRASRREAWQSQNQIASSLSLLAMTVEGLSLRASRREARNLALKRNRDCFAIARNENEEDRESKESQIYEIIQNLSKCNERGYN